MFLIGRKKKRNRLGYTLIELILSVLIIAILVGITTPLFRRQFSDLELRNTCYNIAKLIGFAQQKAIGEARYFKVNFDFEGGRYWLTTSEDMEKFKRLKSKYGKIYSVPRNIKIEGRKRSSVFYPNGSSEAIDIVVRSRKKAYSLKSKGRLGHVEVERIKR